MIRKWMQIPGAFAEGLGLRRFTGSNSDSYSLYLTMLGRAKLSPLVARVGLTQGEGVFGLDKDAGPPPSIASSKEHCRLRPIQQEGNRNVVE